MFVKVYYCNGDTTATYIGKILEPPNPEGKRVWGIRTGMHVRHNGKVYVHLDGCFTVEKLESGIPQPIEHKPVPKDINLEHIIDMVPFV